MKRLLILIALAIPLAAQVPAWAQAPFQGFAMRPPCAGPPHPAYAPPGGAPVIVSWTEDDLNKAAWQLSPCLHWTEGRTRMATALAGVVHAPSLDDLLTRYGALSQYKSIHFWSTTHQAWEPFVQQAGVTDGPGANHTYPDLKPEDFVAGKEFYYYEIDARTGRTVHHLTVRQRTADNVVQVLTSSYDPPFGADVWLRPECPTARAATTRRARMLDVRDWTWVRLLGVEGSFVWTRVAR